MAYGMSSQKRPYGRRILLISALAVSRYLAQSLILFHQHHCRLLGSKDETDALRSQTITPEVPFAAIEQPFDAIKEETKDTRDVSATTDTSISSNMCRSCHNVSRSYQLKATAVGICSTCR